MVPRTSIPATWRRTVHRIEELQRDLGPLTDDQLRKKSLALRYEALSGDSLNTLLPEGFALVREAASRSIGLSHYPVQLLGGLAMHHGAIAVMQTGEGKTLTATLPLYLAALTGRGAHLATANDYLAERDAEMMGPVFNMLGLSVGVVCASTGRADRQQAYLADITYSTAKEIGFDFLRDRLLQRQLRDGGYEIFETSNPAAVGATQPVQRPLNFALVDEADSILIDEARTPLIISSLPGDLQESRHLYQWAAQVSGQFQHDEHFDFDPQSRTTELTVEGRRLARKLSKPAQLDSTPVLNIYEQVELALSVEQHYRRDRDYVIRDGQVVIVDEFTGRMAEGRKWKAGLHQAIEAREGLEITFETCEAARITIQDLFLRYDRLAGMTGTVASSGRELKKIYKTPVVDIPTNRPPRRRRLEDRVFGNCDAKWNAIVEEVMKMHAAGRPVLIGTRSIDKSEILSKKLASHKVPHQVLNARHLEREAEIVSQAGGIGRITVATNMAGRGTDIQLQEDARSNGGLHVIISELHESERIDRQLVGRCGRQGDPGSYRCFMSLDDDLLLAGFGPAIANRLSKTGAGREHPLNQWARVFKRAQKKIEQRHFRGRKILLFQEKQRQLSHREMGQDPYIDSIV